MSPVLQRPRIVFDCNILVQCIISETGPAAASLRLHESGEIELLVSRSILRELHQVLHYEELRAISAHLTDARIDAFLERLTYRGTFVRFVRHFMDYPRDPSDEPYLDLAKSGKAHYLITTDNDLLSLMTGNSSLCKRFRRATHPLAVLKPVDFLRARGHPWKPPDEH